MYNPLNLKHVPENNLCFTIDEDLFLEMLFLRIRYETIKFSRKLSREKSLHEFKLIDEIKDLENSNNIPIIIDVIENKKSELENLRKEKMEGHIVRSRVQWLAEGEKPSQYFCVLEHNNYIEKTVKKIILNDGKIITDQKTILSEMKNFYVNLFASREDELNDINLTNLFKDTEYCRLNEGESITLEGLLSISEISTVLKNMKNNKSPGLDGFPADFLKVFWSKLKFFVLRALNKSYRKGILSISLRRCIISCLPKGEKSRELLKTGDQSLYLTLCTKLHQLQLLTELS